MLKVLEQSDLKAAIKILQEKNIFLQLLNEYITKVETLWKETLERAIDLLAKNNFNNPITIPYIKHIFRNKHSSNTYVF